MEILGLDASLARFGCQGRHPQLPIFRLRHCQTEKHGPAQGEVCSFRAAGPVSEIAFRQHGTLGRSSPSAGNWPIKRARTMAHLHAAARGGMNSPTRNSNEARGWLARSAFQFI